MVFEAAIDNSLFPSTQAGLAANMIWDEIRRTFEDYFSREEFSFEIVQAPDPMETECRAVLKVGKGPREQKMSLVLESEDNLTYLRALSPVVPLKSCSKQQLIRLMEQNTYWVHTRVGVRKDDVVFTSFVTVREFEGDPAILGDAMKKLARRADQMETLLFGRDHS